MLTDLLILSVIVIPTIMSDYKLYSFSDVIKKSGIVKPWKTRFYIEEKVSVKPVCGDCCLRTNETINELQLNAELTIQES
jgi:hypothetical protein